jgi:hypothetical protein
MERREFLSGAILGATFLGNRASWQGPTRAVAPSGLSPRELGADLLLVNGDLITLDPRRPSASAALVRKGRIVMVGDRRDVRAQAQNAVEFDAGGRVVVPGFVDNHCHVEDSCVVGAHQPTLRGLKSLSEMIAKVRSVAAGVPKGEWVLMQAAASDFPDNVVEKRWLNRQDLDEATEEHPVMVILGIHASILNTPGWKRTGYWEPGSDDSVTWKTDGTLRKGSFIHRDASGHPAGLATEVWDFRPGYSVDQYKASMRRHFKEWFLSKGLTTIGTIQDTAPNEFLALQELQKEGGLPARLRVYPVVPHAVALKDLARVGWRSGFGDEMFRFGGAKFFVDGIGSDYMGKSVTDLKWNEEALTGALTSCQRGGIQAILHVVTEGGWELAVKSLAAAKAAAPGELHHRIDHRTPVDEERIRQAKSLGLTLGITAPRQKPGTTPPAGAFRRVHRYRTLVARDMAIAVLDAAGPGGNYHPMQGIANMTTEESQGGAAPPGESVTFEDALRMWTLWPARNNSEDHEKGSIEVGKFGDFAVLSADPRGRSAEEVHAIETVSTIVGGEVVYQAG